MSGIAPPTSSGGPIPGFSTAHLNSSVHSLSEGRDAREGARSPAIVEEREPDPFDHVWAGVIADGRAADRRIRASVRSSAMAPRDACSPAMRVRTLATMLEDPDAMTPPEVVVPRLVWKGRATLLSAREKVGKSTLARFAAAQVTKGGAAFGARCAHGAVLWLKLEEHDSDLTQPLMAYGAEPTLVHVVDQLVAPLEDYARAVEEIRPALIVVDTLAAFADLLPERPDSGSASAWTRIMRQLVEPLRTSNAGLLLMHHAPKNGSGYRDSTAIGATCDVLLAMTEVPGDVRRFKARGRIHVESFDIRRARGGFELVGGPEPIDDRVHRFVGAHPGVSKTKVRSGVGGKGEEVDAAVDRLLAAGTLKNVGTAHRHAYEITSLTVS